MSETVAIEKAASEKLDLILMDLDLPDISGIEAARSVKENTDTADIPIIAQTGWSSRQWKGKVLEVGMVDHLQKPVSVELMKATIEKFILSCGTLRLMVGTDAPRNRLMDQRGVNGSVNESHARRA